MRTWSVRILAAVMILGTCAVAAARPKTDTVLLKNGDRVTCEIKSMSRGKLEVQTDSMAKVYVEWADITALNSKAYFHVTASNGDFCFGSIEIREATNVLRVVSDTTIVNLPMLSAVSIVPIEKSFESRNHGSASLGFSYAKSTDVAELYFDISNRYRSRQTIVDARISSTVTVQGGTDGTDETKRRASAGAAYYYIFPGSVTLSAGAKLERNDELDVKMRFLGRLAAGYAPVASNYTMLMLAAGLALNSETSFSTEETSSSLEAVLHGDYSLFLYNLPETAIDIVLDVYPSITEHGRYRVEANLDIRREIIDDFFFDLEFYDDYDNKPPTGGEATSDYGIKTSLGYSWN